MSHKDAPTLTAEQARFEAFYRDHLPVGETWGWGRAKDGSYLAAYPRLAWAAWKHARTDLAASWDDR